jgi:hypothetical protein
MRGWLIAALTLTVAAVAASASALPAPAGLEGVWTYRTEAWTAANCVISGNAILSRSDGRPNEYRARMVSTESCEHGRVTRAEQECIVLQDAQTVLVECRVVSTSPPSSYLPDNFVLEVRTRDLLVGRLTANWNAPAEWRRATPAVS